MTKLNIGKASTSTVSGLRQKIKLLEKMLKQGKFKGKKELTAKRNLAWYKSDLKNDFRGARKKRGSVASRSKKKRSR